MELARLNVALRRVRLMRGWEFRLELLVDMQFRALGFSYVESDCGRLVLGVPVCHRPLARPKARINEGGAAKRGNDSDGCDWLGGKRTNRCGFARQRGNGGTGGS